MEKLMCVELKIKAKHLALEPQIIKLEERKILKRIKDIPALNSKLITKYETLRQHRLWDVRNEARATHLARGYIAGKLYSKMEAGSKDKAGTVHLHLHIVPRILAMVQKYKNRKTTKEDIESWLKS
jgi:hypothetical protein